MDAGQASNVFQRPFQPYPTLSLGSACLPPEPNYSDPAGVEAEVEAINRAKASHEESGSHKEDHRERCLGDEQSCTRLRSRPRGAATASSQTVGQISRDALGRWQYACCQSAREREECGEGKQASTELSAAERHVGEEEPMHAPTEGPHDEKCGARPH